MPRSNSPEHEVEYDGNALTQQNGPRYFMLNKPQGVCSTDDPDHPTVLYFLDEPVAHKLHAAGRLDIDTTGLVLMTDDGQWSHRITSPRHCEKTYLVDAGIAGGGRHCGTLCQRRPAA
jgi:16S rRNA pseudouridine516 synthase